jgi:hypothetical protein
VDIKKLKPYPPTLASGTMSAKIVTLYSVLKKEIAVSIAPMETSLVHLSNKTIAVIAEW